MADPQAPHNPLTLAFMRSHPAQAALVLEALPAAEAASLFAHTPARLGAAVLAAMLPPRAAACLAPLADNRALELLAPMGTQATVALLRQVPEPRRQLLIKGLPTATALASALMLGYADDTLGAWADPDVLLLGAERRVAEALAQARGTPLQHALVFVADGQRRLLGVVPLAQLLHAADTTPLGSLMKPCPQVLSAQSPLASAAEHPGWEQASVLPVVEGGQRLVGVLTRDALARALRRAAPAPAADDQPESLPTVMARSYWHALAGLLDASVGLLPKVAPVFDKPGAVRDTPKAAP